MPNFHMKEEPVTDFEKAWKQHRAGLRPIGYLLRRDEAAHWLRFHSLPESKRYAETPAEKQVLLARQNLMATEALGDDPCWLIQAHWTSAAGVADLADEHAPFRASRECDLRPALEFAVKEEGENQLWIAHAGLTAWRAGVFDDLLMQIADDRAAPTLWMSASTGSIFAPYNGGVDLFLPSATDVRALADAHADWLSSHPSGL